MRKKIWAYNPCKKERIISDRTKTCVQLACDQFVEEYLAPRSVRPFNPNSIEEPQCVAIRVKWHRHFIHFKAMYKGLRPDVIREEYDYPIARLEYTGDDLFHLAYFRHTGEWSNITYGMGVPLEECFKFIRELPHFDVL